MSNEIAREQLDSNERIAALERKLLVPELVCLTSTQTKDDVVALVHNTGERSCWITRGLAVFSRGSGFAELHPQFDDASIRTIEIDISYSSNLVTLCDGPIEIHTNEAVRFRFVTTSETEYVAQPCGL